MSQMPDTENKQKSSRSQQSQSTAFQPGMVIFSEGEERDKAYIIESGEVEIRAKNDKGEELPLVKLGAGEIFGEMALMGPGERAATAVATEETKVFILPRELFEQRIKNMDPLIGLLVGLLVDRYRHTRHRELEDNTSSQAVPKDNDVENREEEQNGLLTNWSEQKNLALKELRLADEIKKAIAGEQFTPFIQPVVSLPDGQILGFEALIRWEHPKQGMIPPVEFVPVAERTNVVQELDLMMLKKACYTIPKLQEAAGDIGRKLFMSVNLSGNHFQNMDIVQRIENIVSNSGVEPQMIKLEITEGALIHEPMVAEKALQELRKIGVSIALDDFGTGYSSLSYLHTFSIDDIKIDRSFVQHIHKKRKSLDIVRAIVALSKTFDMRVIAEGIEEVEEALALSGIGCDQGQGYHFSRPLPVEMAYEFIKETVDKNG